MSMSTPGLQKERLYFDPNQELPLSLVFEDSLEALTLVLHDLKKAIIEMNGVACLRPNIDSCIQQTPAFAKFRACVGGLGQSLGKPSLTWTNQALLVTEFNPALVRETEQEDLFKAKLTIRSERCLESEWFVPVTFSLEMRRETGNPEEAPAIQTSSSSSMSSHSSSSSSYTARLQ